MFEAKPMTRGLAFAFGGLACAALMVSTANAQTQPAPQKLDKVEVTGSLIKRSATESALPVTTIDMSTLEKAGVTTAQDAIQFIAENQSSTVAASSVGATNGGAAYADLRGLGPQRTLVLLNGQRVVNNPYSGYAVDLNTIPTVAIERIEVLRDGASAIYGTDAISGVINIITRKDYEGISVSGGAVLPQGSGGKTYNATLSGGWGSLSQQGFNVFGGFSYNKQDVLRSTDRDYSATSVIPSKGVFRSSGTTFPANYSQSSADGSRTLIGSTNPTRPNCQPPASLPITSTGAVSTTSCRFDFVQFVDLVPEQEQWSFLGRGTVALGADNTLSLEYFRAYNKISTMVAPAPLTGLTMSPSNPFFPGRGVTPITNNNLDPTLPINVNWRAVPAGGRGSDNENTTQRVLGQLEGTGYGWNYNAAAYYSNADVTTSFTNGYLSSTLVQNGLNGTGGAPFLNPFGAQSAAGLNYINGIKLIGEAQSITGSQYGVNATASREIMQLPAGPLALAVGAEYRHEEVDYKNNFGFTRVAASSGLELAEDANGSRNIYAVLAELNIPIVKNLEGNIAVRYDDYSDVGSKVTPKVSLRYQAMNNLLLRGSYNRGFRAPTLYDVYSPNSLTNTANQYDDPRLCPDGNPVPGANPNRDCGQQKNIQSGGNRNVKPETSDSWTIGFVFDATKNITVGVDYWNVTINDSIGTLAETAIFGDPAKYANRFVRCSQVPASQRALIADCNNPGGVDPLAYVQAPTDNLGEIKSSGLDFNAQMRSGATSVGNFTLSFNGTYMTKWEQQLEKNGEFFSALGVYSNDLNFPAFRFQAVTAVNWSMGAFGVQAINRYRSGYFDQNLVGANFADHTVGAYSVYDLTGTWTGIKGLTLSAGVLNLFNRAPPFSNQGSTFQVGFDPRYSNPLDRRFLMRAAYEFK